MAPAANEAATAVDRAYLDRAETLAGLGRGSTHPNPLVGCVLVRDGEIVGEGYHAEYGGPHAEVVALEHAGGSAEGATAFVSLEPCAHTGQTGPCTEALASAGVTKVVFGASDPGPGSGGGERLREAGIEVLGPFWDDKRAALLNPGFFHIHATGRPYVVLKLATTLDGKIAAGPGERTQISGHLAASWVQGLRRDFDAVMVGGGTLRVDDPLLTVREGPAPVRPPARVVLDTELLIGPTARIFDDANSAHVHIFCADDVASHRIAEVSALGARVHPVGRVSAGVSLRQTLDVLWAEQIRAILCEGGSVLAAELLRQDLVQRMHILLAPMTIGSEGVSAFPDSIPNVGWTPRLPAQTLGRDVILTYDRSAGADD